MRRTMMLGLMLLAFSPAAALGQTCLGRPSFSTAATHLNLGVQTGNDVTAFGGGLAWGGAGPFVGVNAAFLDFDDVDENAFTVGGDVGYQIVANPTATTGIQWCPIGSVEYQIGPEFDFFGESIDLSALSLGAGVSLGVPLAAGPGFQLIPTGGAAFAYTKITADVGSFSDSDSETYGIISLGLGFLMNRTFAVTPLVRIPVGLEGSDPSFGISVTFALGGR